MHTVTFEFKTLDDLRVQMLDMVASIKTPVKPTNFDPWQQHAYYTVGQRIVTEYRNACHSMQCVRWGQSYPESSVVARIWYYENGDLEVRMKTGAGYIYMDVPERVAAAFKHTASAGTLYNRTIKGRYEVRDRE